LFYARKLAVIEYTFVARAFRAHVDTGAVRLAFLETSVEARAVLPRVDALAISPSLPAASDVAIRSIGFAVSVGELFRFVAFAFVAAFQVGVLNATIVRQQ